MLDLYLFFLLTLFGYDRPPDYSALTDHEKMLMVDELRKPTLAVDAQGLGKPVPPVNMEPYVPPPLVEAEAGIVVDPESGKILWERRQALERPIASLTKLMTAAVIVDAAPDFSSPITATAEDEGPAEGSWLGIQNGEVMTLQDALAATLIGSRNNAVRMLVRGVGMSEEDAVRRMNEKAAELGMIGTHFTDVTGLDAHNISTPRDLARLVGYVFTYERLRTLALETSYDIVTVDDERVLHLETTNELLPDSRLQFRGAKTGFLDEAGYTFAAHVEREREQVIVVLLGAPSAEARFVGAGALADWAFRTHRWFSFFTHAPAPP